MSPARIEQYVELRDGRRATIRPIAGADAPAIHAFIRDLSWRTRLERFFAPLMELSPWQLERIMSSNGLNLGVFDDAGVMVAHAQYVRDGAGAAEFGIVVADAWQKGGLGCRLMVELLAHAADAGLRELVGVALADNDSMRGLARALGFTLRRDADPQLVRLEHWLGNAHALAA